MIIAMVMYLQSCGWRRGWSLPLWFSIPQCSMKHLFVDIVTTTAAVVTAAAAIAGAVAGGGGCVCVFVCLASLGTITSQGQSPSSLSLLGSIQSSLELLL